MDDWMGARLGSEGVSDRMITLRKNFMVPRCRDIAVTALKCVISKYLGKK